MTKAGIIAAGHGERLRPGTGTLKPLVRVGGETLIARVLGSIADAGASEVAIIVNDESLAVRDHVAARRWPFALRWIVETTPSSMHSFLRVLETLAADGAEGPFLMSTVDTVAPPGAYARFLAATEAGADVTLALTPAVDDDTPLLVAVDGTRVTSLGAAAGAARLATAGYYAVRPAILREADEARRDNLTALRGFLARLLARGYRIDGVRVAESVDVDRPADVDAAEAFLQACRADASKPRRRVTP
jgi:NDP-sugar pyrophosphorylase family protein